MLLTDLWVESVSVDLLELNQIELAEPMAQIGQLDSLIDRKARKGLDALSLRQSKL
jgi:hypothetical protein